MLNKLIKDYFGESVPLEERNLNLGMLFFYGSFGSATFYAMLIGLGTMFYLVTTVVVLLVTITYASIVRYKIYNQGALVIGILVNLVELPLTCYLDGKLISAATIYFMLGFLFVIFNTQGIFLWVSVVLGAVSYTLSMIGIYLLNYHQKTPFSLSEVELLGDVIVPFAFCLVYADRALIYKQMIHQREVDKAMKEGIKAEDMSRGKEVFLMNMSHEMRTPMNAIISATGLIEDKAVNNSVKQSIGYIQNACNALVSTIDDLLLFSKVENSRLELVNTEYDARQLFEDIINMIAVRLMDTGVSFFVHIDSRMPLVMYGDNSKLRQVFINILNNSVKYTTEGYVGLSVTADISDDGYVDIHADIKDTGIGIREEDIPRLFNAFERLDDRRPENRDTEGTGLGLSICKTILDTMGGSIKVMSEYNRGSIFSFDVRQRVVNSQPMAGIKDPERFNVLIFEDDEMSCEMIRTALSENGVSASNASDGDEFEKMCREDAFTHIFISVDNYGRHRKLAEKSEKKVVILTEINRADEVPGYSDRLIRPVNILNLSDYFNQARMVKKMEELKGFTCPESNVMVIDDNRTNLFVAEGLLKRYKMNVVSVLSGREALNLISDLRFDLIFIDYMMPEMDGIDTLKAIRENPQKWCKDVPCIVLTADAADGARQMLLNAGFDDYISKPIKVDSLATTIYELIDPELIVWNDSETAGEEPG